MSVKWLIQDVNLRFDTLEDIAIALKELEFNFCSFGIIPFTNEMTGLENHINDNDKYIIKAGTKILTLFDKVKTLQETIPDINNYNVGDHEKIFNNLRNGIFYDIEKFDQYYYSKLNLPLLNNESEYYLIKDNKDLSFSEDKFIKPSRDIKAFNGGILEAGKTINEFIHSAQYQEFYEEEYAVIAPCQKIYKEYRLFIVEGKVVAGSQYKSGDIVKADAYVPSDVIKCAKEYASLYQPHDIFTLDIADTPKGFKIVEYNCWNASGTYKANLKELFTSVQKYVEFNT